VRARLWLTVLPLLQACQTEPQPAQPAVSLTTLARPLPGCMFPDFSSVPLLPEGRVPVAFRVSVNAQGTATAASVVTSSASPAADQIWVDALLRCKYSPATANGRPIDSIVTESHRWNHHERRKGLGRCHYPPYPSAARKNNEQGDVVVGFVIDPLTRRAETQLETSSGHPRLDETTKRHIDACLEHEEVRNDYPPGKPQKILHQWRLRETR
jgi:TonB family protein